MVGWSVVLRKPEKLGINELVRIPPALNDLKARIYYLDVGKLKTVPIDLKILSNAGNKEVVETNLYKTLSMIVNSLENKILVASTLI